MLFIHDLKNDLAKKCLISSGYKITKARIRPKKDIPTEFRDRVDMVTNIKNPYYVCQVGESFSNTIETCPPGTYVIFAVPKNYFAWTYNYTVSEHDFPIFFEAWNFGWLSKLLNKIKYNK